MLDGQLRTAEGNIARKAALDSLIPEKETALSEAEAKHSAAKARIAAFAASAEELEKQLAALREKLTHPDKQSAEGERMLLQIKPLITFAEDGQLQSVAKVRGRNQVIDKLVAMTVECCGAHKKYNLAIANGGAPEEMKVLKEKLIAALPDYDHIWEGEIDSTLSVYIGDGILGAAVQVLD